MRRLGLLPPKKIVKFVRILDLADVPPKFLMRPQVIAAVRAEVMHDLSHGLKRVPAGCEADFADQSIFGRLIDTIRGRQ